MAARIGIDVGGTFTDFVLVDALDGRMSHHKEPSTPLNPEAAVGLGIKALLANAHMAPSDIELVVHGTTISLNAIIQRKGARVAVVVSPGNRDLLEIGRLKLANAFDFFAVPEDRMATRDLVLEIGARIDSDGSELLVPDATDFDRLAADIERLGAVAVAVVLINAYANPGFERRIADEIGRRVTGISVVASTDVWPETREYERGMIAVMNAYVAPAMDIYYRRLLDIFAAAQIAAPLLITSNNGGTIDIETARDRPIESILSGPAAGVVAAIDAARTAGIERIVTFDMGGTSADIAIAEGDAPEVTTRTLIGELPLILPVVNVTAIGAGGGSIVRIDSEGVLKVGPNSAGADPGPVCYARGGTDLTITDCYLICGFLDPAAFLGGRLVLSLEAANRAMDKIVAAMSLTGKDARCQAAEAAIKVASSMMGTEIRKLLARRGGDPKNFTLLPYGGAGPTHAAMVAGEAGIEKILIAPTPGTFCALGGILANLRRDFVRSSALTVAADGRSGSSTVLAETLDALLIPAKRWTTSLQERAEHWRFDVSADMRYPNQAFDLSIEIRDFESGMDIGPRLAEKFHDQHRNVYAFNEGDSDIVISRIVLSAVGSRSRLQFKTSDRKTPKAAGTRPAYIMGAWRAAQHFHRQDLAVGQTYSGPLIVDQSDTTIVVPPGWRFTPLANANLLLTKDGTGDVP